MFWRRSNPGTAVQELDPVEVAKRQWEIHEINSCMAQLLQDLTSLRRPNLGLVVTEVTRNGRRFTEKSYVDLFYVENLVHLRPGSDGTWYLGHDCHANERYADGRWHEYWTPFDLEGCRLRRLKRIRTEVHNLTEALELEYAQAQAPA
ncbi:MAG: hypothetical protein JWN82_80 [Candidatus Saccharibacteria bacterium]|nr:hypothetical protein [Candidatus Saccharibacteria bacterium]